MIDDQYRVSNQKGKKESYSANASDTKKSLTEFTQSLANWEVKRDPKGVISQFKKIQKELVTPNTNPTTVAEMMTDLFDKVDVEILNELSDDFFFKKLNYSEDLTVSF